MYEIRSRNLNQQEAIAHKEIETQSRPQVRIWEDDDGDRLYQTMSVFSYESCRCFTYREVFVSPTP